MVHSLFPAEARKAPLRVVGQAPFNARYIHVRLTGQRCHEGPELGKLLKSHHDASARVVATTELLPAFVVGAHMRPRRERVDEPMSDCLVFRGLLELGFGGSS